MELISKIILPICLLIIMAERISYRRKRKELLRKLFPAEITAELAELQIRYVKKYRTKLKGRLMDKGIYRYEMPKGFIKNYYKEIVEPSLSLTKEEKEKWRIIMKSKCLMPEKEGIPFVKILKGFLICFALFNVFMAWYHLPIRHYNEDGSYDEVTGIFRPVHIESYLEDGTKVLEISNDYSGLKNKTEHVKFLNGDRVAGCRIENGRLAEVYDGGYYENTKAIKAQIEYVSDDYYSIEVYGRDSEYDTGYDVHIATVTVKDGRPETTQKNSVINWCYISHSGVLGKGSKELDISITWNDDKGFCGEMLFNVLQENRLQIVQWGNKRTLFHIVNEGDNRVLAAALYDSLSDKHIYEYKRVQ